MSKRRVSIDWRELTWLIESNLKGVAGFGSQPRVEGKLSFIAEGIGHDNYFFRVADEAYVLRLPKRFGPIRSKADAIVLLQREMETLRRLESCQVPLRIPKAVCPLLDAQKALTGLIETALNGYGLKHMENGWNGRSRLAIIGEVAARVHDLPVTKFDHLEGHLDSESHIRSELEALPAAVFGSPVATAAREWILEHVMKRPAVVLHGDLLPQNILCDIQDGAAICLVDWERAQIGDPAYDLAIVTRGNRQPQKEPNGLQRLLDAYAQAGEAVIDKNAVRIHEMLMIMGWLAGAMDKSTRIEGSGHGPEYYEAQLSAVLKRSHSDS